MNEEEALFACVRFPLNFTQELQGLLTIRSRETAFRISLEEFGVVYFPSGSDPRGLLRDHPSPDGKTARLIDSLREALESGAIRSRELPVDELPPVPEVQLGAWELSPLGRPWRACVVEEGPDVVRHFEPAFATNDVVEVLDPGLGSLRERACRARGELLRLCREYGTRRLVVYCEFGLRRQKNHEEKEDVGSVRAKILEQVEKQPWGGVRPTFDWRIRGHGGNFHDRFLGFTRREPPTVPLQAATVGGGVQSFVQDDHRRVTAIARISARAFENAKSCLGAGKWSSVFDPP